MTRKFYRSFSVLLAAFAAIVTLGAPASTLAQT
ncbi:MAG: hypothetical protein FD124_52, partial [Alphaproteobacteria bacterium]